MVQLEHLRCEARSNGRECLYSVLEDIKVKEVHELARAAGLRVRQEDNVSWMSVGYVIDALWMVEQDRLQWHNDFSMESAQVRTS